MARIDNKIVNTRLALKYDSVEHWEKSSLLLYPGEVAISYETDKNGNKINFRLKVGTTDKNGKKLTWSELEYLTSSNSPDITDLSAQLADIFVAKSNFDSEVTRVISENKWVLDCGNSIFIKDE